jgi:hypothetical protein
LLAFLGLEVDLRRLPSLRNYFAVKSSVPSSAPDRRFR